jgi:Tol biopolymer transport system component
VTSTTGDTATLDANGFVISIDGQGSRSIGINATVVIPAVPAGARSLLLGGAAENCSITEENPRNVMVVAADTVQVAFTITCAPVRATLVVKTFQSGGIDPDGYTISLDGGPPEPIGISDTRTYEGLAPGRHVVLLDGLAPGCEPSGPNPHTIHLGTSGSSGINFHVACPITGVNGQIAFYSDRDGDWEIFTMNADGTNLQQLTVNSARNDAHPAWSPDGMRIAFTGTRQDPVSDVFHEEVVIMNADGSGEVAITNHPLYDATPAWSSADRIAFQTNRDHPEARPFDDVFPDEIYTIRPDGSDLRRVTNNAQDDIHPDWSPNGTRIAYSSEVSPGNYDILTVAPDGSGIINLTNHPATDWRPAWSPDGTRIAFHSNRDGNFEIYVMNVDGTGLQRLTDNPADDFHPAWSPDGRMIAFQSDRFGGDFDIYIMQSDGTGLIILTSNGANDDGPNWTR